MEMPSIANVGPLCWKGTGSSENARILLTWGHSRRDGGGGDQAHARSRHCSNLDGVGGEG